MATLKEMKELALYSATGSAPANYEVNNVDAALIDGFRALAGNYNQFMKNRYDIYEIITETVDQIVPNRVIDALSVFAEIKVVGEGQKAAFKRKIGKIRAKQFLTQAAINGVYETFRLDTENFELTTHNVGGGATIDLQRMLDGAETIADVMQIMQEGITDAVFIEVEKALHAAFNDIGRPDANKVTDSGFNADHMMNLISTVRAYGSGAVIFAPPQFVAAMGADAIVPVGTNYQGVYHPQDIDAIHNTGYINIFRGTPIVQIPQSFIDTNNDTVWIDPQMAYVLPTGREKVVKVVLEGSSLVRDYTNRDGSMEFFIEKKMGTGILCQYNWGIYKNTAITAPKYVFA